MDASDCATNLNEFLAMLETTDWDCSSNFYVPSLRAVNKITKDQISTPFDSLTELKAFAKTKKLQPLLLKQFLAKETVFYLYIFVHIKSCL